MKFTPHIVAITVGMLGYLLYLYANGGPGNLVTVKAEKDGEAYLVQDLPMKQQAAEHLATLKANMEKLVEFYKQDEFESDPQAKLLVDRFNADHLMETL